MAKPVASSERVRRQMSRQRNKDTGPETAVRRELHSRGLRFRTDVKLEDDLRTRADIAWRGLHVAVYVDGCFWHGCPDHATRPVANAKWWAAKLDKNIERDRATTTSLERRGWTVLRFWEHQDATEIAAEISRVVACARSGSGVLHPR